MLHFITGSRGDAGIMFPDGTLQTTATLLNPNVITESNRTAVGLNSLINNTSGTGNTAAGSHALWQNTVGFSNTAFGQVSLANNTGGSSNTNGTDDVFVRDLQASTTTLVSVNSAGTDSGNGLSFFPAISADGRFVVFGSISSDLVATDTNGFGDVFVRDLQMGTTTLVSINNAGNDSGNSGSGFPVISADGRFVAFLSYASDLVATDTNGNSDVFVSSLNTYYSVAIDIMPRNCPNKFYINCKWYKILIVSILGTDTFDVGDIDKSTVRLEGIAPVRIKARDVAAPSALEPCDCEALPGDTYEDLVLYFKMQDIIDALGDVNNGDEIPLTLTAILKDGTEIEGSDCVLIETKKWGWKEWKKLLRKFNNQ
jgi:hypothetical protein